MCLRAYNARQEGKAKEQLAVSWQTANFMGAAFAGKLRRLSAYIKDGKKATAPKISQEEFEKKLAKVRRDTGDA